jgi:hypothetical protein
MNTHLHPSKKLVEEELDMCVGERLARTDNLMQIGCWVRYADVYVYGVTYPPLAREDEISYLSTIHTSYSPPYKDICDISKVSARLKHDLHLVISEPDIIEINQPDKSAV